MQSGLPASSDAAPEQRLQLLIDAVSDYAIFMLDPQGIIISWNTGAQRLKGYTREDIIGRHFSIFYPPEAIASGWPQEELRQATALGRMEDEGWRVRKDGSRFWANVVISAVRDAGGRLVGFAKVTRDMSERRRLEELERSSRRMNEFLAMLAHELRNPLAPIRNAVTIMQLESLSSPVLRNCRDVIDRQLTHVTRLVDDLLDVGRLTTGKIKLRRELTRMSEVIHRSVETARPVIEARRHQLHLHAPEQPMYVNGDSVRLSQVVQNLLVNAAKYTPEGGRIDVTLAEVAGFLQLSVTDTGRGIAPDQLERIFELFMQAEMGSGENSGLGIGLTLARSLVEAHGGSLGATSPGIGLGSTFTVTLPQAMAAEVEAAANGDQTIAGTALRVMVVDDNRDSADSATDILRLLGNRVECAYDGASAVEIARRFQPAVILLDLAMPGMDGFEARRRLLQAGLDGAFMIAMTGFGNEDDKRRTRAAGFQGHLTKPVELDALISLLNEAKQRLA